MNKLMQISRNLAREVDDLTFLPPVAVVYNPLDYARGPHEKYLSQYGQNKPAAILVGMNPGPFGMAQTGVPFGDIKMVREFLHISGSVTKPKGEHPKRPIDGFACTRSEVSGTRVWTWAKERFGTADNFFQSFFVVNYCPLVFMGETGKNITPDKLPKGEREQLFSICDGALRMTVEALEVPKVVGIGEFARKRCVEATGGLSVEVGRILHPSPASPAANRGWAPQAEEQLAQLGLLKI